MEGAFAGSRTVSSSPSSPAPCASGKAEAPGSPSGALGDPGADSSSIGPTSARTDDALGQSDDGEGDDSSSSESDDAPAGPHWVVTKAYEYLVHPVQPRNKVFGSVLQILRVKRPHEEWPRLDPDEGQLVVVDKKKFHLLLCIRLGRVFRVVIRDEVAKTNFCSLARDVSVVETVPGKSKARLQKERAAVFLF